MKKTIIFYIVSVFLALSISACTDLHEQILDEEKGTTLVTDTNNIEMLAAPAYAFLRDLQSRNAGWLVQESCTDEVVFPTRGANWNSADYRTIFTHDYAPDNLYIKNLWNSYLIGFARCNLALYYMNMMTQTSKIKQYNAEVRFVRALSMYQMNDCFGMMPFRPDTLAEFTSKPKYLNRLEIVNMMIEELNTIIPVLKNKGVVPYGRITKAAAQTLLAKIYLNYQVYTGTAPAFADGTAKWAETIALCDAIIGGQSGTYTLADDYWKLFLSDNATYSDQTETILPIIYDSKVGLGGIPWLNMTLAYNQNFGSYSNSSFWNGCCTTPTFFNLWSKTDTRFSDNRMKTVTGFNLGFLSGQQYNKDGVALKTKDGDRPLIYTNDVNN